MKNLGLQEYLSLGYLYLMILGLVSDTIFYKQFGINILSYSSISDVLISPINLLTSNYIVLMVLLLIVVSVFLYVGFILPKMKKNSENSKQMTVGMGLKAVSIFLFTFTIGIEIGRGYKYKVQIMEGKTIPDHIITFTDSKKVEGKILGQNSTYLFFVSKNEKSVIIFQISNSISQISLIKK